MELLGMGGKRHHCSNSGCRLVGSSCTQRGRSHLRLLQEIQTFTFSLNVSFMPETYCMFVVWQRQYVRDEHHVWR